MTNRCSSENKIWPFAGTSVNPALPHVKAMPMYEVTKQQVRTISRKDSGSTNFDVEAVTETLGQYLAGFANGEGSFNLSFRPRGDYRQPWKISLCFNVSQRDPTGLMLLNQHLRCGTMRQREDGVWYY